MTHDLNTPLFKLTVGELMDLIDRNLKISFKIPNSS